MLLRNRPPDVGINLCLNNERIARVHETKFLGVFTDDDLNWKHHINMVRSKLSKVAAIKYKASCLINQEGMYILHALCFCHTSIIVVKYGVTSMLQIFTLSRYYKNE